MSVTKTVYLWCDAMHEDGKPCGAWVAFDHKETGGSQIEARKLASRSRTAAGNDTRNGWSFVQGKGDLCREHSAVRVAA
jgi:hypothetical protein